MRGSSVWEQDRELKSLFYRPEIDGLRAISVAGVIVYHAFPKLLPGGFAGVDVFFVISGFLISFLLLNDLADGTFSLLEFYARRAKRILPALVLVVSSVLLIGNIVMFSDERVVLGRHVMASATFMSNFNLWSESGYFDEIAELKPLLHLWSLAIEEQFYLLWPIALMTLYRGVKQPLIVLVALVIFSFCACLIVGYFCKVGAFYNPLTRFWELALGATVAFVRQVSCTGNRPPGREVPNLGMRFPGASLRYALMLRDKLGHAVITAIGLALIGTGFLLLSKHSNHPGFLTLLPTIGASMVLASGDAGSISNRVLSARFMVAIGLISYPLYLWHWPLLSLSLLTNNAPLTVTWKLTVILISVLLAMGTYLIVEKPFRFGRWRFEKATALLILLAILFIGGFSVWKMPKGSTQSSPMISDWSRRWRDDGCSSTELSISKACRANGRGVSTVAIIGDSHAQGIYLALAELTDPGTGVVRFASPIPFLDVNFRLDGESRLIPADETNKIIQYVANERNIKIVILAFRGVIAYEGTDYEASNSRLYHGRRLSLDLGFREENSVAFRQGMLKTLKLFEAAGKNVVFVLDNPELGFNPKQCAPHRPYVTWGFAGRNPCAEDRYLFEQRSKRYVAAVREILTEVPSVRLLDLSALLCDEVWCWAAKGGKFLYQDFNHLSDDGLRFIAPALVAKVAG